MDKNKEKSHADYSSTINPASLMSFDTTMRALVQVPKAEVTAKIRAEKRAAKKRRK